MGKLRSFGIVLSNQQAVYCPGQTVDGYVNVELQEEMKMREIRIRFVGAARVRWSEGSGKNRRHYWNNEGYFDIKSSLYGREQTQKDEVILKPGAYQYPFRFQLPMECPSSFETRKGHVRYFVQAIIDRPWRFDDTCLCVFTVLTALDLNQVPNALNPLHKEATETSCCLCCKAGPVRAVIDIPKTGYVPGESILIKAEVNNEGSREVQTVFAELVMVALCHSTTKTGSDSEIVSKLAHGGLKSGETDYWNNEVISIPPLPASYLRGCRIIEVHHYARIRASVSGIGMDICVPVEVIIGTIPITQRTSGFAPAAYPPPPSYSEYALGQTSIQELEENQNNTGDTVFTPKYTYYDFSRTGTS